MIRGTFIFLLLMSVAYVTFRCGYNKGMKEGMIQGQCNALEGYQAYIRDFESPISERENTR